MQTEVIWYKQQGDNTKAITNDNSTSPVPTNERVNRNQLLIYLQVFT